MKKVFFLLSITKQKRFRRASNNKLQYWRTAVGSTISHVVLLMHFRPCMKFSPKTVFRTYNWLYWPDFQFLILQSLTELIKVCVHAIWPRDGTHKSGFEEGCPFIGQTPQPTHIILKHNHTLCNKPSSESAAVQRGWTRTVINNIHLSINTVIQPMRLERQHRAS